MGTKYTDGCFQKAEDDEPLFTLLARDPLAPSLVRSWAWSGDANGQPPERVQEALDVARAMEGWRREHRPHKAAVDDLLGVMFAYLERYQAALKQITMGAPTPEDIRDGEWGTDPSDSDDQYNLGAATAACAAANIARAALAWQPEGEAK